jgi:hypothetical protein
LLAVCKLLRDQQVRADRQELREFPYVANLRVKHLLISALWTARPEV